MSHTTIIRLFDFDEGPKTFQVPGFCFLNGYHGVDIRIVCLGIVRLNLTFGRLKFSSGLNSFKFDFSTMVAFFSY